MTDLSVAYNSFTNVDQNDYNPNISPRALPSNQLIDITQVQYGAEQANPRPTPNLNKPTLQPEFTPRSFNKEQQPISNVNQQFATPPPVRNPSPMDQLKQQRNQDSMQFKEHFNGQTMSGSNTRSFQARTSNLGELTRKDKIEKENVQTNMMPNRTHQGMTRPIPPAIVKNPYNIPKFTRKEYNQYAFPFIPYFRIENDKVIKSDTRAVENNFAMILIVIIVLGMLTYRLIR